MKVSKARLKILINEVMSQMVGAGDVDKGGSSGDYVSYSNNPNALKFSANYIEGVEERYINALKSSSFLISELLISLGSANVSIPYAVGKIVYTICTSNSESEIIDSLLGLVPGKAGNLIASLSTLGINAGTVSKIADISNDESTKKIVGKKIKELINDPKNTAVVSNIANKIKKEHPDI